MFGQNCLRVYFYEKVDGGIRAAVMVRTEPLLAGRLISQTKSVCPARG